MGCGPFGTVVALAATWNIANLGAQERRSDDLGLIAEVLSWFDPSSRNAVVSSAFK